MRQKDTPTILERVVRFFALRENQGVNARELSRLIGCSKSMHLARVLNTLAESGHITMYTEAVNAGIPFMKVYYSTYQQAQELKKALRDEFDNA